VTVWTTQYGSGLVIGRAKVTAVDSLATSQQADAQRLGHGRKSAMETDTRIFTQDQRDAGEKLRNFLGTGRPEINGGKLISFPYQQLTLTMQSI